MAIRFAQSNDAAGYVGNPARELARSQNIRLIGFLLIHIPLAFLLSVSPWISTAHALLIVFWALLAALRREFSQVLVFLAYIGGGEVLWRMTQAHLLWEHGKYMMIAIAAIALVVEWRGKLTSRRFRTMLPLVLLVVLLPAVIPSFTQLGFTEGRDQISFNLSGHAALVALALYVWERPINRGQAVKIMLALIAPIIGVAFLSLYNTLTTEFTFIEASNFVTSGGYGPNQVSNLLGLGALMGIILITVLPKAGGARFALVLLVMGIIAQGLLTFSRGGLYSLALALVAFGLHLTQTSQARRRFILLMLLGAAVAVIVIFPYLNNYTGGSLARRFADLDTTGRLEAAEADLQAFAENPVAGVGVGLATVYRYTYFTELVAAHTEFTRLLAEHGLFGVAAILIMVAMLFLRYRATPPGFNRALVASFAVWSTSIMMQSAMRFSAISFVFALALVAWQVQRPSDRPALFRGRWLRKPLATPPINGNSLSDPASAATTAHLAIPKQAVSTLPLDPLKGNGVAHNNGFTNGNGFNNGNGYGRIH